MSNLLAQIQQQLGWGQYSQTLPLPSQTGISADVYIRIGNLSLSSIDVSLLVLCPLCAALGVLVSFVLKEQENRTKISGIKRLFYSLGSYIGNLFIGLVLGLVVALFFVGAINNEVTSLARVLALSVLLGYQSRHLWFSQESVIKKLVDKKVNDAVEADMLNKPIQPTAKAAAD